MPIIRGHHRLDDHFTQIPNAWLRDPRISLEAKGLLAQLMSHTPGWKVSIVSLARANGCGKDKVRNALNQLIEAGYIRRSVEKVRNAAGHLTDYDYTTTDPELENPTLENPTLDNPTLRTTTITKNTKKKETIAQAELERVFFEFWTLYPRRIARAKAKEALQKVLTGYTSVGIKHEPVAPEVIIDGVTRLASDPNLPPKEFVPYPASWLFASGWLNEPYPVRTKTKEEREAEAAEADRLRRERDKIRREQEQEERRREQEQIERERRENPVVRCEHDRVKIMCPKCGPDYLAAEIAAGRITPTK